MKILPPLLTRPGGGTWPYYLAIGAFFRDEARYLDEWLTFHAGVGVDHFYLYNNRSEDDFLSVLAPWIAARKVTLADWPGAGGQVAAYNHCLRRARRSTRWLAFIDIDEFLFSPSGRRLPEVLRQYEDLPAVFVYWRLFGSSGHDRRPGGPVVEAYTRRLDDDLSESLVPSGTTGRPRQGKSISNPRRVLKAGVHRPLWSWGRPLDEKRRPLPHGLSAPPGPISCEYLRINHYWSKSAEDMAEKARKGSSVDGGSLQLAPILAWEKQLNTIEDRSILPIWWEIKDHISRKSSPSC